MDNLDVMVLRSLCNWRLAGHNALLVTVVRTWGSSPRPVGSIMALCEDGTVVGSVSGGCIEDDLIHKYVYEKNLYAADGSSKPQLVRYGVSAEEAHNFGLPCGGTLELLLEHNADAAQLTELIHRLEQGLLVRRSLSLVSGRADISTIHAPESLVATESAISTVFGPEYRMLLIGAGQLTEYLATMALFNGFSVTVCDPRIEYRKSWHIEQATLLDEMPDDVVLAFRPDRRSCIIALTHDPKLDDLALLEALNSEAFYVGAIGSRRNCAARRERMIQHLDQTAETLDRLRSPVGIYIGSRTPAEIAVSIMAEVIAVRNGVSLPSSLNVTQAKDGLAATT